MSTTDPLAEALAAHPRGDWSDRTYACGGCRQRFEEDTTSEWEALVAGGDRDAINDYRLRHNRHTKPDWTLDEYHAHLADAVRAFLTSDETVERAALAVAARNAEVWMEPGWADLGDAYRQEITRDARAALSAATETRP